METERLADDVRPHCHIQLENKPSSDKQKVVIENVGETLMNQGPIRNKD